MTYIACCSNANAFGQKLQFTKNRIIGILNFDNKKEGKIEKIYIQITFIGTYSRS